MATSTEQGQGKDLKICLGDRIEVKLEDPDGSETWYSAIVTDFDRSIAEVDEENAVEFEVLYEGEGADSCECSSEECISNGKAGEAFRDRNTTGGEAVKIECKVAQVSGKGGERAAMR